MIRLKLHPAAAVLLKDIMSEWRMRYSITTVLLFILTAVTAIVIGMTDAVLQNSIKSALLWTVMFFGAMTGLSRVFSGEEERGTSLFLRSSVASTAVFAGKSLFNIFMSVVLNAFTVPIFFIFIGLPDSIDWPLFAICILLGSIGIGTSSAIISAVIAKAGTKNAVFPVLSFPLLLPLLYCGMTVTTASFEGKTTESLADYLLLMLAYSGAVSAFSFILFDYVWND